MLGEIEGVCDENEDEDDSGAEEEGLSHVQEESAQVGDESAGEKSDESLDYEPSTRKDGSACCLDEVDQRQRRNLRVHHVPVFIGSLDPDLLMPSVIFSLWRCSTDGGTNQLVL